MKIINKKRIIALILAVVLLAAIPFLTASAVSVNDDHDIYANNEREPENPSKGCPNNQHIWKDGGRRPLATPDRCFRKYYDCSVNGCSAAYYEDTYHTCVERRIDFFKFPIAVCYTETRYCCIPNCGYSEIISIYHEGTVMYGRCQYCR